MKSPMLGAGVYGRMGWAVVPLHSARGGVCSCAKGSACPSAGKHPRFREWQNEASSDPEVIAGWKERFPEANIGIATGRVSGLFVLDVDPKNGGRESLAKLIEEHAEFPVTPQQLTGSDGDHYFFAAPEDFDVLNSASKLGAGIDVRGGGGQVVVAPSVSAKGAYRWIVEPWNTPLAPAPEWLLELLRRKPERAAEPREVPPATPEDLADAARALSRLGPAIEGQGGDTKTLGACLLLLNDFALSDDDAWSLLQPWNKKCVPPWDDEELSIKFNNARDRTTRRVNKTPFGSARRSDSRVSIEYVAGRLHENVTELEAALIAAGAPIFQRGAMLVRPVVEEVDAAHGRRTKIARLREVTAAWLEDEMSRHVRVQQFDARSKKLTTRNPPAVFAHSLLARSGDWRFRTISGVITSPTLRPDGSILSEPGFDESTKLLLLDADRLPPLELSEQSARASLGRLDQLLDEFPFVDDASRSVALSAILTAVARGACDVVPAHAASASTAGSGKSFLWDVSAAIAIGQRCPVLTAPRDDAELEKRLGAALLSGQPLISLDNMTINLAGDTLAQVIERPLVEVRILGRSELARIESRASVFATGNNLAVAGDLTRRVLLARLDAGLERPELRQFKSDPFARVLADRPRYVADALTVVASYAAAGRPGRLPRLASFGQWSDTVRSALVWLGKADPCVTMEDARANDPLLSQLRSVLTNWRSVIGVGQGKKVTATELLEHATAAFEHREFSESVREVASNRGRSDARTLGKWLARHRNRIVDGLQLCSELNAHTKVQGWWLSPCG